MGLNKASISVPHNLLQLPELPKETGVSVIDFLGGFAELRVLVLLNIPHAIGEGSALSAGDFLLLRSPLRELDLV